MIPLRTLLEKSNELYGYSEEDKAIIRDLAANDKEGLRTAMESDKWLMWHIKHERTERNERRPNLSILPA